MITREDAKCPLAGAIFFAIELPIITVIITFEDVRFVFVLLYFSGFNQSVFFGFDLFQKFGGWFVCRILRNQFSPDGKIKDFLLCQRDRFFESLRIGINNILEYLPPYSPELNPIERVWKLTRRLRLHNRYFPKLEDVFLATESLFKTWQNGAEDLKRLCRI